MKLRRFQSCLGRVLPMLITLFALAWLTSSHGAEGETKSIRTLVREAMTAWNVPGVALLIVRDDEIIYLDGHGVRELGKIDPVTADTLFPLASCSKALTTAALAMLVDEGKLHWDDPVRKHLPWFHLSDELADGAVTLRDLVTHRTGLAGHDFLWYRALWTPEEAVKKAGLLPLDKPFRSAFQYQSTMFTAAGLTVAAASQMPWEEFIKTRIFEPLEMRRAVCSPGEAREVLDRATGHRLNGFGKVAPIPLYVHNAPDAAGTIHASARDLAPWLRLQLGSGQLGQKRLISATALGETHTPQIPIRLAGAEAQIHCFTEQISYGMGWVIQDYRGLKILSHGGMIDGYRAHLTLVPDKKIGIAILNNRDRTQMNLALSNTLLDRLLGFPAKNWHQHIRAALEAEEARQDKADREKQAKWPRDTKPSLVLTAYVGDYEHPAYGKAEIRRSATGLTWTWAAFGAEMKHQHFDVFEVPIAEMGSPQLVFEIGGNGKVLGFKMAGGPGVEFRRVRS